MKQNSMSLKALTENCRSILEKCSIDELKRIIIGMADKIAIENRQDFINSLLIKDTAKPNLTSNETSILGKIDELESEVLDVAHEEPDWESYSCDDEDSSEIYEQFIKPLATLFDQVEALFDNGDYKTTRIAYEKLLSIVEMENEYGRSIDIDNISSTDPARICAKYLCSIYLTELPEKRVASLIEAMNKYAYFAESRPKLTEIINAAPKPLPDQQAFLTNMIETVSKENTPAYRAWLREAVFLLDGISGLEKFALNSGNTNQRIYLDWIQSLINNNEYSKALQTINLALNNPALTQPIKAAAADLMLLCGQKNGDTNIAQEGLWVSFENKPSLDKLIALYDQLESEKRKISFLRAAQRVEEHLKFPRHASFQRELKKLAL